MFMYVWYGKKWLEDNLVDFSFKDFGEDKKLEVWW